MKNQTGKNKDQPKKRRYDMLCLKPLLLLPPSPKHSIPDSDWPVLNSTKVRQGLRY